LQAAKNKSNPTLVTKRIVAAIQPPILVNGWRGATQKIWVMDYAVSHENVMNKQEFLARLDYFNMVHGVTMRAIAVFSNGELGYRPNATMRTPATSATPKTRLLSRT
jgi:hypothetical protein